jgi:hypothetical protein
MRVAAWLFPFPFLLSTPQVVRQVSDFAMPLLEKRGNVLYLANTSDEEEEDEFRQLDFVAEQLREKCIVSPSFGLSSSTPEHPHRTLKRVAGTRTWICPEPPVNDIPMDTITFYLF